MKQQQMGAVVTNRASRIWVAICGITGVVMLTAHFFFPAGIPSDNAPPAVITRFVLHHHAALLTTGWLQGFGPLLYVLFALGLVYLAGGMTRFWGWLTMLSSARNRVSSSGAASPAPPSANDVARGRPPGRSG